MGRPLANKVLDAALLAIGAYAALMIMASFIPVQPVVQALKQYSGSGDPTAEIMARFSAIASRARLAGATILVLTLLAALCRRAIARFIRPVLPQGQAGAPAGPPDGIIAALRAGLRSEPAAAALLLAMTAAGLLLRLVYVGRPMRHDEAWTYMIYGRMPYYLIPIRYTDVNDHVLNTFLIHSSTLLFGDAVTAIRLPALLFGLAIIPAGFLLARLIAGTGAALIAAALLATASSLIEFSVNARGYTALAFFALVMLAAGYRAITTSWRLGWVVVTAAGTLGLYTVPTMIIPAFTAYVWLGLLALAAPSARRLALLADLVASGLTLAGATALLYLPIFIANGIGVLVNSNGVHSHPSFLQALQVMPGFASDILQLWGRDYATPFGGLLLAALPVAAILPPRGRRAVVLLLAAAASGILLQLLALHDIGPTRIWLPFLAIFLVLAAIGLDGVIRRLGDVVPPMARRRAGVSAAVCLALTLCCGAGVLRTGSVFASDETAFYPPAKAAAGLLTTTRQGDIVGITNVRSSEIQYYAKRIGIELTPVETGDRLRYFRINTAHVPAAGAPQLLLLVDGVFDSCKSAACADLARRDHRGDMQFDVLQDAPNLVVLRQAVK